MNNRSIAICYGQYTRSEDKEHHCWVNNRCPGWGCRKLNAIGPQNSCPASAFKFCNRYRTGVGYPSLQGRRP